MNLLYVLYFWIYEFVTGCDFFFFFFFFDESAIMCISGYVEQKQVMKNVKCKAGCDFFLFVKYFMDV